MLHEIKHGGH